MLFWALAALIAFGPMEQAGAVSQALAGTVEVERIGEQGRLILRDGGKLCLSGIWAPTVVVQYGDAAKWRSAWRKIIEDRAVSYRMFEPSRQNRYGCDLARVETNEGVALQEVLLEEGWAVVDPASAPDDAGAIDVMLDLEAKARRAARGLWRHPATRPKKPDDLSDWIGTRQIVEGHVRRVSENDRYIYLNFGADWRTDFTVRLLVKLAESDGLDPAHLPGKKLRVRGVLQESRGPLIDISHLKQIEFLP